MLYLKDTQKWKQFTTIACLVICKSQLCYISKILKNESNSQPDDVLTCSFDSCVISQRYSKMKAIHNGRSWIWMRSQVVLYLKDTQKWKQFTTVNYWHGRIFLLCYISKILKNESNSQLKVPNTVVLLCCVISQRYSKMKAIHNWRSKAINV